MRNLLRSHKSKGRYKDNWKFVQWFKMFVDAISGGQIFKRTRSGHAALVGSACRKGLRSRVGFRPSGNFIMLNIVFSVYYIKAL